MEQAAMSELIKAYEATLDKGVSGLLILLAVALVVGTLAFFWTRRTAYKAEVNKGQAQNQLGEMFAQTLAQHRLETSGVIDRNTHALERNADTREKYTLAFNETTHALETVSETMARMNLDLNSRMGLTESTISNVDSRVQTLVGVVSALDVKVERMSQAVSQLPTDYAQTAALVRGVAAELHQLNELIISTLRPPKVDVPPTPPALQPTQTPEQ